MIDATFTKSISDLAQVQEFKVNDSKGTEHVFTSKSLTEIRPQPPLPVKVLVNTLSGFAALVNEKLDGLDVTNFFIHVEDHRNVSLVATKTDEDGRRLNLIHASPVEFEPFTFGRWIPQEDFIIAVSARFAETSDKAYVLSVASSLTDAATSVSEDDGFTQKATVKAGMKTAETVTLKGQVNLAPFRTFPEIGQPISSFVFRAKSIPGAGPNLMLVEADGGKWKIDAMAELKSALSKMALEPTIIA